MGGVHGAMHGVGRQAASWSWARTQPLVPVATADAVTTASGRSPSVVSAWAWWKTSGMTEISSRWLRKYSGLEVIAVTFAASAAGRCEVDGIWPAPRRLSVGINEYVGRIIILYWPEKAGIAVNCSGLELSSSTIPATWSGYRAA